MVVLAVSENLVVIGAFEHHGAGGVPGENGGNDEEVAGENFAARGRCCRLDVKRQTQDPGSDGEPGAPRAWINAMFRADTRNRDVGRSRRRAIKLGDVGPKGREKRRSKDRPVHGCQCAAAVGAPRAAVEELVRRLIRSTSLCR